MNNLRLLVTVAALAISGSGCVILFNMPANRFVSPESQEDFGHGHVDLGVGGSEQVVLSPNSETVFANTTSPAMIRANAQSRFAAEFGVIERLDVSLRGSFASNEPAFIEGKYQLIGPSRQKADAGDFSLAGTLAYGGFNGTGDPSDTPAIYKIRVGAIDTALIGGFRAAKPVLIYGGYFYTLFLYSGDQTLTSTAAQSFDGDAHRSGLNLGVELGEDAFRVKLEIAQSWATAEQGSASRPYFGVVGAFYF
ncbi:MAG TPA: hypothetical protein VM598_01600 [Bdellovibrionota bacterium]|nr:hypothetical protein [Bdellovibrionota bacterium]